MGAMIVKELRQLRRDRRTVALLLVMPLLFLTVFGYAASFDVAEIRTLVAGPQASALSERLPEPLVVTEVDAAADRADVEDALRRGEATVGLLTGGGAGPLALVDGSDLFAARAVVAGLPPQVTAEVLYNPDLETAPIMVPGLVGLILVFVGTIATSLGVVRERQAGTLETLAVMPLRPRDVFIGKVLPYFGIAALDTAVIVAAGSWLFDVPFRGDSVAFALGAAAFLFVTLGIGVLVSGVSQTSGQAIQLALMTMLPQLLLSGLIFPVSSMAAAVQPIAYVLPLTWFIALSRGIMLRGATLADVALPLLMLAAMGAAVFAVAVLRFRRDLLPRRAGSAATVTIAEAAS